MLNSIQPQIARRSYVNPYMVSKQPSFRGAASGMDVEALQAKQRELQELAEKMSGGNEQSTWGKLGKFATKAFTVLITFTATKVALGKASEMITGSLNKTADKLLTKAKEGGFVSKAINKLKSSKIDEYIVNTISGGAALGVALKEMGMVKKQVSENTENLVDTVVDKATDC